MIQRACFRSRACMWVLSSKLVLVSFAHYKFFTVNYSIILGPLRFLRNTRVAGHRNPNLATINQVAINARDSSI
jgi:hypothetical protein